MAFPIHHLHMSAPLAKIAMTSVSRFNQISLHFLPPDVSLSYFRRGGFHIWRFPKKMDFFPPYPLVPNWNWFILRNSRNLTCFVCFSVTPSPSSGAVIIWYLEAPWQHPLTSTIRGQLATPDDRRRVGVHAGDGLLRREQEVAHRWVSWPGWSDVVLGRSLGALFELERRGEPEIN